MCCTQLAHAVLYKVCVTLLTHPAVLQRCLPFCGRASGSQSTRKPHTGHASLICYKNKSKQKKIFFALHTRKKAAKTNLRIVD